MTNELIPMRLLYTPEFLKDLKYLRKKYRSIQSDVDGFIKSISTDNFPGDRL